MKTLFLAVLIFIASCSAGDTKKEITLSSGRTIVVSFEKQIHEGRDPVLFVDYVNEEKVIKTKTVEDETLEIWNALKEEVEITGVQEALVKYSYFTGRIKDSGEKEYGSILFDAEKTESGNWKLRKVN
ncbi:MAG: hypothetical protein HKN25_18065 [Pyrinomonadaceae bacterium]|nr:hypothetical protein [Pyrinomonadaceae bacterium]